MGPSRQARRWVDPRGSIVPLLVIALAVVSVTATGRSAGDVTRLAQLSPAIFALDVLAGLSMVAAGVVAWRARRREAGMATMLAGLCWFGADWAGTTSAPGVLRAVGLVGTVMTLPIALRAVVATRPPWLPGSARAVLGAVTIGLLALTSVWLVAWVPSFDLRCLAVCDRNPVGAGVDFRLARSLSDLWQGLTIALAAGSGLLAASRGLRSPRRGGWPMWGATLAIGAAWTVWGFSILLPSTVVAPTGEIAIAAYVVRALALVALAAAVLWWTANARRIVAAIERLADRLAPFPEAASLSVGLAGALADPTLRVVYPMPDGRFVDVDGRTVDRAALRGSARPDWEIRRSGELVAVVLDASTSADAGVAAELGDAVLLAADNERLLAVVRHEVAELRASRTRIVQAGDHVRRRIERDLHDGAQQRMLGIVSELSSAAEEAGRRDDPRAPALDQLTAAADDTIEALRAIARGIHPAMLDEAGLAAALETLADQAAVPLVVDRAPETRYPPAVESAVWRVIARVVAAAGRGDASAVRVALDDADGRLLALVSVDGMADGLDPVGLADVVGAAGGEVHTMALANGGLSISASLPCA